MRLLRAPRLPATLLLASVALGCGDEGDAARPGGAGGAGATSTQTSTTGQGGETGAGGSMGGACAPKALAPWSRKIHGVGGTVVLDEVMFHPAGDPALEWIELHNPLAIDLDLSGFRLAGDVAYTFPDDTFLAARGYVVVAASAELLAQATGAPVAIGSYTGALPDDGGTIELWNNAGRLLDRMEYGDEPWPLFAGGSGATLAKADPTAPSELVESWIHGGRVGGTPGTGPADPAAPSPAVTLLPLGSTWRALATGADPGSGWASPAFDDTSWSAAPAAFYAPGAPPGLTTVTAKFTADNFFALYVGKADGSGLQLIGRDSVTDWSSPEVFSFQVASDDHLFVAAWEAPGDSGGPQSLLGEVALPGGGFLSTDPSTFEWILGPPGAAPGGSLGDPAPSLASIQGLTAAADQAGGWAAPQAWADNSSPPWGWALSGAFAPASRFIWGDTFDDVSVSNAQTTFLLFRSIVPILPAKGATELPLGPTTYYFRTTFDAPGDVAQPWIDALVDDGAVFYLNGAEVLRLGMPAGPIDGSTLASATVGEAALAAGSLISTDALVSGSNVLAVEVHEAAAPDIDMAFDASVGATLAVATGPSRGLAFNEVSGAAADDRWVELSNRGAAALDAGGYVVASSSGPEHVIAPQTLAPGELLLLDQATLGFDVAGGGTLFLYTPDRDFVVDAAPASSLPRARSASDPVAWLYPEAPTPGAANAIDEEDAIVIDEIMYAPPPVTGPDGVRVRSTLEWIELHNRSAAPVDVGGYQLVDAITHTLPAGTVIAPGGYLVVAKDAAGMKAAYPDLPADRLVGDFKGSLANSGERIVLLDQCGNPADEVTYRDEGRWPAFADGDGSSLELRDPRADNTSAEAWAASDEATGSAWQTLTYEGVLAPSAVGPDGQWQELVIGLLDAGEVLLDDVRVTVDPNGAATELVTGGDFESGGAAFRAIGNHRRGGVIVDPTDPANHVLRLVSTGPTEHMHNHLETTLAGGHVLTNGKTYRISLRAKWTGGASLLHTRLYFDRLARTTELALPARHGTPGAPNSRAEANIGPTYRDLRHAPAVPAPGEPVVVSIDASDPDGVAALALHYAVDGGATQIVAMSDAGGGRWSAVVPGGAASSQVQIYVVGEDAVGATSSFPARGPLSRALWKVDDGKADPNGLHDFRILMTADDTGWLFDPKNLMSNDLVGATVIVDERDVFYDVGVRLKGSERGRPTDARVGFGVRFQPDRLFRGVYDSVLVDRSEGVGYGQRETFVHQAMLRAGSATSQYDDLVKVHSPRPQYTSAAALQLARYGDLMLSSQFEDGQDGVHFEYELVYFPFTTDDGTPQGNKLPQPDGVIGTPIHHLGDDEEAYRFPFILKNNRWRDDYRGLIAFAKVFGTGGPAFDAAIADVVDVDQWLRAFAMGTLYGCIDNYAAGDQHNGDLYVRPTDGRTLLFPHDLDFFNGSPQGPIVASGDLAKLIATPERARAFYGHLYDIVTTSYNATYMARWADQFGHLIPGQDFGGPLQFLAARADWAVSGAPDSVKSAIPQVAFQITTNGGAPLAVDTSSVTLDGLGWVDVAEVRRAGSNAAVPVTWTGKATWQATIDLACGANDVGLDALDRRGHPVGADALTVTRAGAGCP
jgi:hypothetical protein